MKRLAPSRMALLKMVKTGLRTRDRGQLLELDELVRQKYLSRREAEARTPGNPEPLQSYALTDLGEAVLAEEPR